MKEGKADTRLTKVKWNPVKGSRDKSKVLSMAGDQFYLGLEVGDRLEPGSLVAGFSRRRRE